MIDGLTFFVCLLLVLTAWKVVTAESLVHSVFWLAGTLLLTAAAFVSLGAPLLAGVQVILYTGGVITLMLFGVMLTRRKSRGELPETDLPNPASNRGAAAVTALLLAGALVAAIWTTPELAARQPAPPAEPIAVARLFLGQQLLAFEVLSVLLLAAMIGAIVLVRRTDP